MNPRSEMFRAFELCLEWWTDRSIRVQKIPSTRVEDGTVIASAMPSDWELIQDPLIRIIDVPVSREVRDEDGLQVITYTGPACRVVIRARVEAASGSRDLVGVQFEDVQEGNVIVAESAFDISRHGESRSFKPCSISQSFEITSGEGLFGLGQQRIASVNMRNRTVNLVQENTIISIPFLVSTGGYGLLWEQTAASTYSNKGNQVTFSSDRATGVSYWFIRGTSFDQVINEFRILTGKASLLPLWAFGFIQGRNRYWTRDEVISVVERHRKMHLPIDMIFIDYMYYGKWGEGSHRFDEASFPDPAGMIRELHEKYHVKLLLSVWPNFSPDADTHHEMDTNGYLLDCKAMGGYFYDPFNHDAGKAFWSLLESRLLPLGVDAWWLDASEPDNPAGFLKARTAWGTGADHANAYSLLHAMRVHDGQRAAKPDTRVLIITRSAFPGQQRYAATAWSGDILPTWDELRKQVASGLSFCASGLPYWGADIGGYKGGWAKDPRYRELFIRWFQWGVFCPIFRSHGRRFPRNRKGKNEIWEYGWIATTILRKALDLRYRLMPYMYSCAAMVYRDNYTMMRHLVFDYPSDPVARDVDDQFMFGPSLLVCPVLHPRARCRNVYFPEGAWWNFHTGERVVGPCNKRVKAPLSRIPVFVKAGTILPVGPSMQHTSEKAWDPLDLWIYPGANGRFDLYVDDGVSLAHEKGMHARVSMTWDDGEDSLAFESMEGNLNIEQYLNEVVMVRKPSKRGEQEPVRGRVQEIVQNLADQQGPVAYKVP